MPAPCPEHNAGFFSKLFFTWINPIIKLGYTRPLQQDDLYVIGSKYSVEYLSKTFGENWKKEKEKEKPSLTRALSATFGSVFYPVGILKLISDACTISSPIVLQYLIQSMDDPTSPPWWPYVLSLILFLLLMFGTFCLNAYFQIVMLIGYSVRTCLVTAIYRKSLFLSTLGRQKFSNGQIVNMMSTDCTRLDVIAGYLHYLWSGPVQIVAIVALLYNLISYATFAGFGFLILLFPVQGILMRWLGKIRKENSTLTDQRVRLSQEILNGIRVIKFYAWEESFMNRLSQVRSQEVSMIRKVAYARAAVNAIISSVPAFSAIICFLVYAAMGLPLKASVIFPALSLIGLLRFPLILFPMILAQWVDGKVSIKRIEDFLLGEEVSFRPELVSGTEFAVKAINAKFAWKTLPSVEAKKEQEKKESEKKEPEKKESEKKEPENVKVKEISKNSLAERQIEGASMDGPSGEKSNLKEFNLSIKKGELVAIVGAVGSGKSSLLSALLGEMSYESGKVIFDGSVGYCPQQAWIQNQSLKDNILFGRPYDKEKYERTVHYCALEKDLAILPNGDQTEIGEKGINLSGGQKQRCSLARAVYYDADIIFLDDPLSAVDAHVGKFLFEECLCNLLKGKTRVLVTHQLHFLNRVDYIFFMKDGAISEQGTFAELMGNENGEFSKLMNEYGGLDVGNEEEEGEGDVVDLPGDGSKKPEMFKSSMSKLKKKETGEQSSSEDAAKPAPALMTTEERAMGAVAASIYMSYFNACGGAAFIFMVAFFTIISQGSRVLNDFWLSFWTQNSFALSTAYYMTVYGLLGLAQALLSFFYALVITLGGLIASIKLHNEAFTKVLFSPIAFFDTTPLGRIINRFSKDMDSIDNYISDSFRMFVLTFSSCIATFALISAVTPIFLAPLVFLMVFYYYAQKYYRSTSRELKRLDAICRSPLYAHFGESLNGIITIRAYREEDRFIETNSRFLDINNRPYFLQISIQRWLSVRLETIGNLLVFFAAIASVIFKTSSAAAGLSIGYALSVTGMLNWCVRQAAETETQMNSVERLKYYIDELESEAAPVLEDHRPPKDWPSEGAIKIENLTLRYRPELPPVLSSINLSIRGREKIGVVGRTGAGKSSIMIALFRMVEAAEGSISIDGINTASIGLRDLRSALSIIPQDPVLYSGTVRSNLDPFDEFVDSDLWEVLERSYLKDYVTQLELKLDGPVHENGSNFSVGQRQLLCLARAMLRKTKILVMDEATANIDVETDSKIQKAIRLDFDYCTILTIAHRLNTIIDYDRVLVLDQGKVMEFDAPHLLLSRPDSMLLSMVEETGSSNAAYLKNLAKEKYFQDKQQ